MKIAVIGGNGQIGNYLLPMLVKQGHEVISISRSTKGFFRDCSEFDMVQEVHLTRGTEDFEEKIAELACDVIVDIICYKKEEAETLARHLQGKIRHYIAIGSIWIHGSATTVPVLEEEDRNPPDEYGRGKLEITDYLKELWKTDKYPATIVHPGHIIAPGHSNIVGPQGNRNLNVIDSLKNGDKVILPNFGLETVHHVHAEDIAGIICAIIEKGEKTYGEEYHAVSRRALTLKGFCTEVAALYNQKPVLEFLPFETFAQMVSEQDVADTYEHISRSPSCSPYKAERDLGYITRTTMEAVKEHFTALGLL